MTTNSMKKNQRIERDAGSGRFVPAATEEQHPKTTVTEARKTK